MEAILDLRARGRHIPITRDTPAQKIDAIVPLKGDQLALHVIRNLSVIDRMSDLIDQYGQVSLADLNALIGASSNFIDDNWGWTDMGSFNVRQVRDGFMLTHDEPQSLKR